MGVIPRSLMQSIRRKYWVTEDMEKHPIWAQKYPKKALMRIQYGLFFFSFCDCQGNSKYICAKFYQNIEQFTRNRGTYQRGTPKYPQMATPHNFFSLVNVRVQSRIPVQNFVRKNWTVLNEQKSIPQNGSKTPQNGYDQRRTYCEDFL